MGNNTSSTRKSTAGIRHGGASIRKSAVNAANHSLDEDFSDLILHEVKKKQEKQNSPIRPITSSSGSNTDDTLPKNEFSNGLIEDEYNELNAGLIETDVAELNRNIIPDEDSNSDAEMEDMSISLTDVPTNNHNGVTELETETPTPDWSKVDFTKILPPNAPGQSNETGGRLPREDLTNSKSSSSSQVRQLIPVEMKWVNSTKENIQKIAIIGSFSNWRDMIRLKKSKTFDNEYTVTIKLPLGVHKLLYVINNEYRISDQLPTATDQEGIFFNWFEVLDAGHLFNHSQNLPQRTEASTNYDANIIAQPTNDVYQAGRYEVDRINRKSTSFLTSVSKQESGTEISHVEYMDEDSNAHHDPRSQGDNRNVDGHQGFKSPPGISDPGAYTPFHGLTSSSSLLAEKKKPIEYSSEIPAMFVNYEYFKKKGPSYELPEPPQLPAHLNNVLLNKLLNPHQSNTSIPTSPAEAAISAAHLSSSTGIGSSSLGGSSSHRPALRRADSSYYASSSNDYLAIPNHVILNHLMTTSIRNEVLTVACITRYLGKFVTQIMHSPADT